MLWLQASADFIHILLGRLLVALDQLPAQRVFLFGKRALTRHGRDAEYVQQHDIGVVFVVELACKLNRQFGLARTIQRHQQPVVAGRLICDFIFAHHQI